jgi:hypothetical protein
LNLFVVVLVVQEQLVVIARYLVAFFKPRTQIDRLAALGTKGTVRIILPRGLPTTSRTLDRQRHGFPRAYAKSYSKNNSSTVSRFSINP